MDFVGLCCVCDAPVDECKAGYCDFCGQPFHWSHCGGWSGGVHCCENCNDGTDGEPDLEILELD